MRSLGSRVALFGFALAAFSTLAPAAHAQTSISDYETFSATVRTLLTVELRDASGAWSGKALIDHPRMGQMARPGWVPQPQLEALEKAVIAADLFSQPGQEWTGAASSTGTQMFTDENGNYSELLPGVGPNGVDVTPEMLALEQAMSAAFTAFQPGAAPPPAPTALLSYTFASTTIGEITLDVASDGSCHLHGGGTWYNGIDSYAQLPPSELASLKAFLLRRGPAFDRYPDFGKPNMGGAVASITYTDANGNAKTVRNYGGARVGVVWAYLQTFLRSEALSIDPAVKF
jgi:hypothetical protein